MARQEGTAGSRTLGSIRDAIREARERTEAAAAKARDAEQRGDTKAAAEAWAEVEASNDEETRLREEYTAATGRELDGEGNPGDLNIEAQREAGHVRLEGVTTFSGMTKLEMLKAVGVDPAELDGLTPEDVDAVTDQILEREQELREEGVRDSGRRYVEQVLDVDVSQLTDAEVAELVKANKEAFDAAQTREHDNMTDEGLEALRNDPELPESLRGSWADQVQDLLDKDRTTVVPGHMVDRVVNGEPERPMGNDLKEQLKGFAKEKIAEVEARRDDDGMNPRDTVPGEAPPTHSSPDPMQGYKDERLGTPEAGGASSKPGADGGSGRPGIDGTGNTGGGGSSGSGSGNSGGGSTGDFGQPPGTGGASAATGSSGGGSGFGDLVSGIGGAISDFIGTPPPPPAGMHQFKDDSGIFHDLGDGVWREGRSVEGAARVQAGGNPAPAVSKEKQKAIEDRINFDPKADAKPEPEPEPQPEPEPEPQPEPEPDLEYTPSGEEGYSGPSAGAIREATEQYREIAEAARAGSTVNPVREGGYEAPTGGTRIGPAEDYSLTGPGGDGRLDGAAGQPDGQGRSGTDWGSSTGAGVIDYGPDALVDYGDGPEDDMPTEFGPNSAPITVPGVDSPNDDATADNSRPPVSTAGVSPDELDDLRVPGDSRIAVEPTLGRAPAAGRDQLIEDPVLYATGDPVSASDTRTSDSGTSERRIDDGAPLDGSFGTGRPTGPGRPTSRSSDEDEADQNRDEEGEGPARDTTQALRPDLRPNLEPDVTIREGDDLLASRSVGGSEAWERGVETREPLNRDSLVGDDDFTGD